jgi:energy-coupling factor transporter ATP-binding protein EcfA2
VKAAQQSSSIPDALEALKGQLEDAALELEVPGVAEARRARAELVGQVEDYLLPRLLEIDAPLLTVVGGSTGAGKSTLVNSIVGAEVSAAGVLRPTTRAPVLVCHPDDLPWFSSDRILPELSRTTGRPANEARSLQLVGDADVPPGVALLDAPDIDSVVQSNRELAAQLLAAADLWLFVTTAARYADAVPWELLRTAESRSTALAVVLNRVPAEALHEVPTDLARMLERERLGRAPVLTVPEAPLHNGLIPRSALAPVTDWLDRLAADDKARAEVVRMTLEGALDSLGARVGVVADAVDAQGAAARDLLADVQAAYDVAEDEITQGLTGGALLRGEVLARWHEFIGTGEFMRTLEARLGWARDRVAHLLMGRPPIDVEVRSAVESSVETVVLAAADKAAERSVDSWSAVPGGRALLQAVDRRSLERSSVALRASVDGEVRSWQSHVLELVSAEGASKRATGRALSFGVNSVGVALMVAVFAHTGGLTGAEVVVAGGTATLSQKVLEALFGDQAVRDLTARARADLLTRIRGLLDSEAARFESVVAPVRPGEDQARALRNAAAAVDATRS